MNDTFYESRAVAWLKTKRELPPRAQDEELIKLVFFMGFTQACEMMNVEHSQHLKAITDRLDELVGGGGGTT